jgi:hypothetical protein
LPPDAKRLTVGELHRFCGYVDQMKAPQTTN